MKKAILLTTLLTSFFSYAQSEERLGIDEIRFDLESKCKEHEGKLRFENLSAKIGEKPNSLCYRYSCDVQKSYAEVSYKICPQDKNSKTLLNIQQACLSLYGHKESQESGCTVGSCLLGERAKTEGNQIALNDVQVVCLNDDSVSPAVIDDLRKWGKSIPETDNTSVRKPVVPSAVKKQ